jgi:putative SOS response-associated peptidase YedK
VCMPVVLSSEMWDEWLRHEPLAPNRLDELVQPAPADALRCHMVSTVVNSARKR